MHPVIEAIVIIVITAMVPVITSVITIVTAAIPEADGKRWPPIIARIIRIRVAPVISVCRLRIWDHVS